MGLILDHIIPNTLKMSLEGTLKSGINFAFRRIEDHKVVIGVGT